MVPITATAGVRGKSPNEKLNIAVIGAGGKGRGDTDEVAELGENIYALCDVDKTTLDARTTSNSRPKSIATTVKCSTKLARTSTR